MPSFTVALATSGTIYNLLTLVRAIDADFTDCYSEICLTSGTGNSTSAIHVGGAAVSATDYGFELSAADDTHTLAPPNGRASLKGLYAIPSANDLELQIFCNG